MPNQAIWGLKCTDPSQQFLFPLKASSMQLKEGSTSSAASFVSSIGMKMLSASLICSFLDPEMSHHKISERVFRPTHAPWAISLFSKRYWIYTSLWPGDTRELYCRSSRTWRNDTDGNSNMPTRLTGHASLVNLAHTELPQISRSRKHRKSAKICGKRNSVCVLQQFWTLMDLVQTLIPLQYNS